MGAFVGYLQAKMTRESQNRRVPKTQDKKTDRCMSHEKIQR